MESRRCYNVLGCGIICLLFSFAFLICYFNNEFINQKDSIKYFIGLACIGILFITIFILDKKSYSYKKMNNFDQRRNSGDLEENIN